MRRIFYSFLCVTLFFTACQKDELLDPLITRSTELFDDRIPLLWNQLFLEVERFTPGYRPPVSARNCAYINYIAYEAGVYGSDGPHQSLSSYFDKLDIEQPDPDLEYDWEVAVNAAYEAAFEYYFPTAPTEQKFKIIELSRVISNELLSSRTNLEVYNRSVLYGQKVAEAIYEWSESDEYGHEAYLNNHDPNYVIATNRRFWKPTYPDFSPPLLPNWGKVRTFALVQGKSVPPPPEYSEVPSSTLYIQAKEVKTRVDKIKSGQDEEGQWIAEFWSDDCPILTFTPSGRFISITNQLVQSETMNLMEAISLYAQVGMSLSDSGVRCWGEKYRWNLLRPIDYIRLNLHENDWNTVMCPDGSGRYFTPNFPAYPSGHATFGAAAAIILEEFFGARYTFTDLSHDGRTEFRGQPRSFSSFREMAVENALSRIPLGVHFRVDADAGLSLGYSIGQEVLNLPWKGVL